MGLRPASAWLIRFSTPGNCLAGDRLSVYRRGFPHDRGIAQPGSAAVLGTAGRWLESSCPDEIPLEFSRLLVAPQQSARSQPPLAPEPPIQPRARNQDPAEYGEIAVLPLQFR